jgi:hypothetical protein
LSDVRFFLDFRSLVKNPLYHEKRCKKVLLKMSP